MRGPRRDGTHCYLEEVLVVNVRGARPPPAQRPDANPTLGPLLLQFEIRQLRAHLAQQGLDLAAEREAALLAPQVCGRPHSRYHAVEETATEGLVEGLRPSPGKLPPRPPDPRPPGFPERVSWQGPGPPRSRQEAVSPAALTALETTSGTLVSRACGPPHPSRGGVTSYFMGEEAAPGTSSRGFELEGWDFAPGCLGQDAGTWARGRGDRLCCLVQGL